MRVDEAWSDGQPGGVDNLTGLLAGFGKFSSDICDFISGDADIGRKSRRPGSVADGSVLDEKIEHISSCLLQ